MNKNLNAKCKSEALTGAGGVIVGGAGSGDITEANTVGKISRTPPPGANGTSFVLHLRVTRLVICVLRSFSRNGNGGETEDFDFCQKEATVGNSFSTA